MDGIKYSMKPSLCLIAFVAIISFAFPSCQREIDSPFNPQNTDTSFLTRAVSLDTTQPTGQDTAFIINFRYDALKRLQSYDFTEIGGGGTRYTTQYTFYYKTTTDTVPFKMLENYNPDSMVTYLFYSGGFIIRDSSVNYTGGTIDRYSEKFFSSLGGNRFLMKQYDLYPGVGPRALTDSTIYYRTLVQGNLTAANDSTWDGSGFYRERTTEQIVYDNKNGFTRKFDCWYLGHYNNLIYELWPGGLNNAISYSFSSDFFPPSASSYTLTHQYNAADYPVVSRLSGNPDVNKQLFTYTRL